MEKMHSKRWLKVMVSTLCFCSTLWAASAYAIDLWEFRAQDVLPVMSEFKATANLSANQQALWQQVENKTRNCLRERDARRQAIQERTKKRLQEVNPELRDVATLLDQDDVSSATENQEMRAAWMDFYDALSDPQRASLVVLLRDQMARVEDKPKESRPNAEGRSGNGTHRGKGGMGNRNSIN